MRAEVISLKINNAANESLIALLSTLEQALTNEQHQHGELLAEISRRKAAVYNAMPLYRASRAWYGEKASNSLHYSGVLEPL